MKDAMKYQNVAPDTWIFPSKMSIYVSMVPSSEVSYQEVGRSSAVADNNDISKAPKNLLTFRGCTVHETRPFDMDFSGAPSELLRREQMIGNYYTMLPHARPAVDDCRYKSDHRSIYIFNMDVDRFEKVHMEDAIDNCFRFANDAEGTVHHAHASVLYEHGLPSSKDVSMQNDPLFCHNRPDNLGGLSEEAYIRDNPKPNGVCVVLGDLPLDHFKGSDLRDWVESVKCAADKNGAIPANADARAKETAALGWYEQLVAQGGAGLNLEVGELEGDDVEGDDVEDDNNENLMGINADRDLVDALENAWDPLLIASLHNDQMPVNSSAKSASELKQAYHAQFPQTWKNLLTTQDIAFARKQVVKQAKSLIADPRAYTSYLSNANDHYAEHLTDRVLAARSEFIAGGLLEQALSEMQSPSKGKRTKAAKRIKEFVDNFETTAEYFKRENPDLQDNAHVLREILRSYIQPMAAPDAQRLEEAIEAKVMNKETVTPDMLDALRTQLSTNTSNNNINAIANELQQAAADMSRYGATRKGRNTSKIGDGLAFDRAVKQGVRRDARQGRTLESLEYVARIMKDVRGKSDVRLRQAFMRTKITRDNLKRMAEHDIIVPFGFMLTRPFERYDMCSAILCKSGTQLGNTYMGHNDFQLTDDVIHKVHVGHYTFYSKSIIHDEKQYQIAENVFGAGYKGGENTRFYQDKAELMDDIHAEAFRASIICMLLPYRTNQGGRAPRIENPIDITGKLHPTLYAETDIPEGEVDSAQYPGGRYYAEVLELKKLSAYASDATEHFMSPFKYLNTVCFQGAQFMYNNNSGGFTDKIKNTGHWGNVYNGVKKVRNGENAFMKEDDQRTPM